ncbi:MAG TPA: hypothetical protein VH208_06720 [Myxococcaceae bacterium]|nr:hypothetical protein [Myxococcaceae bacterium]
MSTASTVGEIALIAAEAFERAGVDYALGGSVASSIQGEPRFTNDIDFAVRMTERQVPGLLASLGADFEVDEEALREAIRTGRSTNIFYLPLITKIDLFLRGGRPFDTSELSRRVRVPVGPGSGELYIATPEDNLLRKLVWFKAGGEVSDSQWRDVLGLLRLGKLDAAYLNQWAKELDVEDLLARARAQS